MPPFRHYAAVSPLHCRSSAVQPERRFPRLWLLRRFLILPFYRKTAAKSIFFFLSSPLFSTTVQKFRPLEPTPKAAPFRQHLTRR